MVTVLVIQAHPHIDHSLSLPVGQHFIKEYQKNHPDDQIITRDLYSKEGVPPLNDTTMLAWRKQKFGQTLTEAEQQLISRHDAWLSEFVNANKYVFINPMYNHFLPAEMKQYLDLTAVAHQTFKYTPNGPVGLLHGKKSLHIQASGSIYHKGGKWAIIKFMLRRVLKMKAGKDSCTLQDLGSLYLSNMLKFYGITNQQSLYIEGADAYRDQRDKIKENALGQAESLAKSF